MNTFDQPVSDFMSTPVETIHPDVSLKDAERHLGDGAYSCLAVTDPEGHLCGVISRTDILRVGRLRASMGEEAQLLKLPHQTVRTRMTRQVITVDRTTPLCAAAAAMVKHHIHRVFVIENSKPVGVLATRDLMLAIVGARIADPISRWMSRPVITISATRSAGEAIDLLQESRVRGLVVEEQEWPVGVFTQTEALAAAALPSTTPVEEVMSCALLCLPLEMPVFRAAAFARETSARRILATKSREIHGILSGIDMARVVAGQPFEHQLPGPS